MKRKLLSVLLVTVMLLTCIPLGVVSVSAEEYTQGVYTYTVIDGEATITGYTGSASKLTIPSELGGYPVTTIGNHAFHRCWNLTSVTIPDSVTAIGNSVFYLCSSLTSITIPNSVTTIGSYAFEYCTKLTSITIPNSVTTIGECAFRGCDNLQKVTIPFVGNKLNGTKNTSFGHIFSSYCRNGDIPKSLKTVVITGGTKISARAFEGCSYLTSITIPDGVTSIGRYAFSGCAKLTSITIPDSVTTIGDDAFSGCAKLTSITIPDSVTTIGDDAFSGCAKLTSITIPNSVTTIGEYAFEDCVNLTRVTIPDGVTSIGRYAFSGCDKLTSITIPNSVTTIGNHAFSGCDKLTSITLPFIGNKLNDTKNTKFSYIFSGYYDNRLPESLKSVVITGRTKISARAFEGCSYLTSITIPDGVTSIGDHAFSGCAKLTSITIPDSVTTIGDHAFSGCAKLTSITIPNSVTTIGDYAFSGCAKLTSITIPDSVTTIGRYAFSGCAKLTSITIPNSVTTIGEHAFCECKKLKKVNYLGYYKDAQKITIGECNRYFKDATWTYKTCKHSYTNSCDATCNRCGTTRTIQHKYKTVVAQKATQKMNGYTLKRCTVCKHEKNKTAIYKASKISLYKTAYAYNGKAQKPTVTIKDSQGKKIASSDYTIKWLTDCKKVGTHKVKITLKGNYSGTKTLSYTIEPTIKSNMTLVIHKTGSIGAKSNAKITYLSSNKKVATVNSKGVITAVKAGTTYVTVKSGTIAHRIKVVVQYPKLTITASSKSVDRNKTLKLTAKSNLSGVKVTWSVSNKKIAKISSKGVVTGLRKGTVTVTAKFTYKGKTYKGTYKVAVQTAVPKLYVENLDEDKGKAYYCSKDTLIFRNYGDKKVTILARGYVENSVNKAEIKALYPLSTAKSEFTIPSDTGFKVKIKYKKDEVMISRGSVYVIYFEYDKEVYSIMYNRGTGDTTIKHHPNG